MKSTEMRKQGGPFAVSKLLVLLILIVASGCSRERIRGPGPVTFEGMRAHYIANGFSEAVAVHDEFYATTSTALPGAPLRRNKVCWIRSATFNPTTRGYDSRVWSTTQIYDDSNVSYIGIMRFGALGWFREDWTDVLSRSTDGRNAHPFVEGIDSVTVYTDDGQSFARESVKSLLENFSIPFAEQVVTERVRNLCDQS